MLDTGLKNRFVFQIATLFFIGLVIVSVTQYYFFRSEQWRLIDERIETTASLLLSSNLSKSDLADFESARVIVQEVIGSEPFNQFIRIFNHKYEIVYQSGGMISIPPHSDVNIKWQTITGESGSVVRLLTVPLKQNTRWGRNQSFLQVGLILNDELIRLGHLKRMVVVLVVVFFLTAMALTFLLVRTLLRPLDYMAQYLGRITIGMSVRPNDLISTSGGKDLALGDLQEESLKQIERKFMYNDEFGRLMNQIHKLSERITESVQSTQRWMALMAHEIRTPLTVIQNNLDQIRLHVVAEENERGSNLLDDASIKKSLQSAEEEILHIQLMVTQFLKWVELNQLTLNSENLHVINVEVFINEIIQKLSQCGRLRIQKMDTLKVFCNRDLFRQLLINLVENSLKYSPADTPIDIYVGFNYIEIRDMGPGIPDLIKRRLGTPFNHENQANRGFGLGLAWVKTICDLYGFKIVIIENSVRIDLSTKRLNSET